ncbi:hypothetical protein [Pseudoxanthomonas suwonensis]|uniref:hypothetical protein n=1 Tax=Pseudoxanthomonas suwonensis TaxID=314722 RepID=UPI00138F7269|nr:hypothetical protein [Pseudoxanthomonas suwonensis]KAF1702734.1 hypothetical protein CSC68_05495 [Pseudoxanthomonas suwonensis]
MHSTRLLLAAALAGTLLAGCAGASKVMLGQARPPIDPSEVKVYSVPPPGSQDVAQLEASSAVGFGTQGQTDAAVERLKREAAALGANGVVLVGVGSSGSPLGMSVGAGTFGRHTAGGVSVGIPTTQKKAAGIAIWVPPGAVAPQAAPEPAGEPASSEPPEPAD